jgi:hypothetical protein
MAFFAVPLRSMPLMPASEMSVGHACNFQSSMTATSNDICIPGNWLGAGTVSFSLPGKRDPSRASTPPSSTTGHRQKHQNEAAAGGLSFCHLSLLDQNNHDRAPLQSADLTLTLRHDESVCLSVWSDLPTFFLSLHQMPTGIGSAAKTESGISRS